MGVRTTEAALTGAELARRVDSLGNLTKREKARACGYFTVKRNGAERIDLAGFYEALLAAKGVVLDQDSSNSRGRVPTYTTTVHKNGQIIIGSAYTQQLDLKPGTEFEIHLGRKSIKLVRCDSDAA